MPSRSDSFQRFFVVPHTLDQSICLAILGCLIVLAGCTGAASRLQQVSMNPSIAGKKAMEKYDTDGDGLVGGLELDNAPSLKAALSNLDSDGDGQVSASEVADRVSAWQGFRSGMVTFGCQVEMNGKPLPNALVTFEPESFLGDNVETAIGTTNSDGYASIKIPKENRPSPDSPPGLRMALYLVKISKQQNGQETIPEEFNTATTLGKEISPDDPDTRSQRTTVFKVTK